MRPVPTEVGGPDRAMAARRATTRPPQWDVVLAVSLGGVGGAEARYGLSNAITHTGRQFPWSTLIINVSGCLLIGVLMVLILELTSPHRLIRPFLGVGVLGGYTTFSTFAVDAVRLVDAHRLLLAAGYVIATALLCLLAVFAAVAVTQQLARAVVARRVRRRSQRST